MSSPSTSQHMDDVHIESEGQRMMETVNGWVKESTSGMIGSILEAVPVPSTRLLLLNSI